MKDLEDKLVELIKEDSEEKVITINGDWGIGKTYFWNDFIKNKLPYEKASISLYGMNSLEEIENSILYQIYDRTVFKKIFETRLKAFENINIVGGITPKTIFSLIEPKNFKNIIICFDDLERLSDNISINDLFGFISDLKENKKCKVVMILNEDRIKDNFKDDFNIQKEKIIDYELLFEPDFEDTKDILEKKLEIQEEYKKLLYSFMEEYKVNNIRILKRMINTLNYLKSNISEHKNIDNIISKNIFEKTIKISFVYYHFNFKDFQKLIDFKDMQKSLWTRKFFLEKTIERNLQEEKEKIQNEINDVEKFILNNKNELEPIKYYLKDFEINDIEKIIINFVSNHVFDKLSFKKYINNENYKLENSNLTKEFNELKNKYECDFNYTLKEYDKNFFKFLKNNKEKILKLINLNVIQDETNKIKEISSNNYDELLIQIQKCYLKEYEYINYENNVNDDRNIELIMNENNHEVMKYYNELIDYERNPKCMDIIELFNKAIKSQYILNIKEENTINKLSKENIKEFILISCEFVKILLSNYERNNDFTEFKNTLKISLEELAKDEKYRNKVNNLKIKIFSI